MLRWNGPQYRTLISLWIWIQSIGHLANLVRICQNSKILINCVAPLGHLSRCHFLDGRNGKLGWSKTSKSRLLQFFNAEWSSVCGLNVIHTLTVPCYFRSLTCLLCCWRKLLAPVMANFGSVLTFTLCMLTENRHCCVGGGGVNRGVFKIRLNSILGVAHIGVALIRVFVIVVLAARLDGISLTPCIIIIFFHEILLYAQQRFRILSDTAFVPLLLHTLWGSLNLLSRSYYLLMASILLIIGCGSQTCGSHSSFSLKPHLEWRGWKEA